MSARRLLLYVAAGIVLGFLVWRFITPIVICVVIDGEWKYKTGVCDLGTYDIGDIVVNRALAPE